MQDPVCMQFLILWISWCSSNNLTFSPCYVFIGGLKYKGFVLFLCNWQINLKIFWIGLWPVSCGFFMGIYFMSMVDLRWIWWVSRKSCGTFMMGLWHVWDRFLTGNGFLMGFKGFVIGFRPGYDRFMTSSRQVFKGLWRVFDVVLMGFWRVL